jgi:hypothetical protein
MYRHDNTKSKVDICTKVTNLRIIHSKEMKLVISILVFVQRAWIGLTRGALKLTGENLKLVWAEFSTKS